MIEWLEDEIADYTERYQNALENHNYDQMKIEWARVEAYQRCLYELQNQIKQGKIEL